MLVLEDEGTTTADVAQGPGQKGPVQHRGLPVFDVSKHHEFQNFNLGTKMKFKQWRKLIDSPEVHDWVKSNPNKSFYIQHNGIYIKVKRGKE